MPPPARGRMPATPGVTSCPRQARRKGIRVTPSGFASPSIRTVPLAPARPPARRDRRRRGLVGLMLALPLALAACQSDEERIEGFMQRGEAYVEQQQYEEAIIEFKNVLQLDPEHPGAHEALSLSFLQVDKPREAYWEMSETVRVDPENLDARLRYGTISAAIGDYDLSLEQAEAVLKLDPENARAFTLRAQALESREDFEGAESDLRAAIDAEPDAPAFRFLLGNFLERRGRADEAESVYRELLEVEESFLAALTLARLKVSQSDPTEEVDAAIERVIDLVDGTPTEGEEAAPEDDASGTTSLRSNVAREDAIRAAYTLKAAVAYDRGDFERALEVLEEGVQKSESKVELIYQMAGLHRRQGDREGENAMIRRASEEAPGNAAAQLVLSAYLGQQGQLEGALEAARAAVAAEPGNRAAQLREAELLVDLGFREGVPSRIQRGREIVDAVLEAEPDSPEAFFVKAKMELAEGDIEAAKASLENTLQARPGWGQARFVLGSALAASGDLARARVELESAVESDPGLADARALLTRVYAQLGEHEFAIEEGRSYLRVRPRDIGIRIVVGQSLIRLGRSQEAYDEISEIPEEQRNAAALYALGQLDLAFDRIEEGAAKLRRAEQLSPGNPQVLRSLLAIDQKQGKLEASYERIRTAVEANPESSDLAALEATVKQLQGDVDGARDSLQRAIELDPRNLVAYQSLADLERRAGNREGVVSAIEAAAAAVPESSDLQFQLAQLYEQTGRRQEAIETYEKAIALNGDLATAKNNLAYLLAESGGDLDRALELAQQAKELRPDDGNSADTLGWVLLKRGVPSAAIGYLQEAAERFEKSDPRFPLDALVKQGIVRNHLAEAYAQNGDTGKAIDESRRTVEIYRKLADLVDERGIDFDEPDWSKEAKNRLSRLENASS